MRRFRFHNRGWVIVLCFGVLCPELRSQVDPADGNQALPRAEVTVSLTPTKCKLGTPVSVRFQISNTGSVPFYIPPIVDNFGRGGFDVQVTPPLGSNGVTRIVRAADPGPGSGFDAVQEAARWIILRPGDFYGATRPLSNILLPSAGRFTVTVRHRTPRLNDEDKARLRETLKFPVFVDPIESAPAVLDIVK